MSATPKLDQLDKKILRALQQDASLSVQEVADKVGLSSNPCWRRIKKLEDEGIITKRVALVDAEKLGLGMTVFVSIRTDNHSSPWLENFSKSIKLIPEIIECHRLAGKEDYLLKLQVGSISHYDRVYKKFVDLIPGLVDVSSTFSMERVKHTNVIHLA